AESFPVAQVKTLGTGSVPLFAFDPVPIIAVLKSFKPDVVDIHEEPYSVSCFESLLLARQFAPQAACVFYSAQNINKRYPLPFPWWEQFVYRHSQGAYPCSTSVREVLLAKGLERQCPVIPLGVDPVQFSANIPPLPLPESEGERFVIGYTGRLEA